MAQFSIKPDNAHKTVIEEEKCIRELAIFEEEIHNVSSALGFRVTSSANIRSRLKCAADRVDDCRNSMCGMKTALTDSLNLYKGTENRILGYGNIGDGIPMKIIPGETLDDISKIVDSATNYEWWDHINPWLGTLGVVGDFGVLVGDFITGDKTTGAAWTGLVKDGWDMGWDIGDVVETCKENSDVKWWKEIFGLNPDDFLASMKKANLSKTQKLKHGFSKGIKGTLREFKTVGGCAKQVGGIILSGISNYFDNREEYERGEITKDRMWAETVTETAVDWGKDLLIGAGVAAGFAAAGVAAPAVVVGAATVAVSVAADWVCEKVCGKKVTELVSDAIVDVGYKIKDGATALWSGITNGWNMLTGSAGAAFA